MKVIYNNIIPFPGFHAIMLFGLIFARKDYGELQPEDINHEKIHVYQWLEIALLVCFVLLICRFIWGFSIWFLFISLCSWYIVYCIEYAYQCIVKLFNKKMEPYYFITFEQEAYDNDNNLQYLRTRIPFSWIKYLGKWKKY